MLSTCQQLPTLFTPCLPQATCAHNEFCVMSLSLSWISPKKCREHKAHASLGVGFEGSATVTDHCSLEPPPRNSNRATKQDACTGEKAPVPGLFLFYRERLNKDNITLLGSPSTLQHTQRTDNRTHHPNRINAPPR